MNYTGATETLKEDSKKSLDLRFIEINLEAVIYSTNHQIEEFCETLC